MPHSNAWKTRQECLESLDIFFFIYLPILIMRAICCFCHCEASCYYEYWYDYYDSLSFQTLLILSTRYLCSNHSELIIAERRVVDVRDE